MAQIELNAEQIKKALECCSGKGCKECPLNPCESVTICATEISKNALALINSQEQKIKELTEENERLKVDNEILKMPRATIFEIADAFERGRTDGVREMQERLKARKVSYGNITFRVVPIDDIDQIAKEMLEGE